MLEKFTTKELISQATFSASFEPLLRDAPEATGVFSRSASNVLYICIVCERKYTEYFVYLLIAGTRRETRGGRTWRPGWWSIISGNSFKWRLQLDNSGGSSWWGNQLVFASISPKSFFEDYSNQDDGPVLHKDPSWSNGNAARAHGSRDRGLSLRHGLDHHSHHHLHHYAPLCKYQHDLQKLRPSLLEMVCNSDSIRSSPSHSLFLCNYFIQTLNSLWGLGCGWNSIC